MLYKKKGYPEEDELVLCTVTKIHFHSVFCKLDEHDKSGMIHISEVSPGRIRNIRDYVQEGKKVVCKVLRIDREKDHIDLSLRRVNETQRKNKLNSIKQELKAEKIIESLAGQLKQPVEKVYTEITNVLFEHYELLFIAFEEVVEEDTDLVKLGLDKKYAEPLMKIIKEKIKPKQVTISGQMIFTSYAEDGVDIVKKVLGEAEKTGANITYSGAGKYRVVVTAPDYKEAEKILEKCIKVTETLAEKSNSETEFNRK